MHKVILRLLYNGRFYYGFQRQPNVPTIEGELERVLSEHQCLKNFRESLYAASSRTDRGVHALSQTISFYTNCSVKKILVSIEELEPEIHVWAYRFDDTGEFHPRYWALWREYIYVSDKNYWETIESISKVPGILRRLIGCKDYSFLGLPRDAPTFHCIFNIRISKWNNKTIYHIIGSSFTRQMIRKIISILERGSLDIFKKPIMPARPDRLLLLNVRYSISFKMINPRKLLSIIEYHSRREVVFEYLYRNLVSQNAYWYDAFV